MDVQVQELSPSALPHLLNCPAATSHNIHWKWVGNGWSPTVTLPGLECQENLQNIKIIVVLLYVLCIV